MFTRCHKFARAGILLPWILTLGCQSVGPRGDAPQPLGAGVGPAAPAVIARSAPLEPSGIRQVADWPAERAGPWRPLQRVEELPQGSGWVVAQHVGEATAVSMPAPNAPQPPALTEAAYAPVITAPPPRQVPPAGEIANGHPPFPPEPPPDRVPPGHAPFETKQVSLPPYRVGPPDILLIESTEGLEKVQPVRGPHLVRPDGTVGLGIYGSVYVNGMTVDQVREAVSRAIFTRVAADKVKFEDIYKNTSVDVIAYNSQVYYVITDGAGLGQQVVSVAVTGRETVLDAVSKIYGLSPVSSKHHIWIARRASDGVHYHQRLDVDWIGITERGETTTNYQIMPGDRVFVQSDRVRLFDNTLAKFLSPVERLFGVTLLSSQAINSIRSGSTIGGVR
jgi:polysaccharide export outer membrane protein